MEKNRQCNIGARRASTPNIFLSHLTDNSYVTPVTLIPIFITQNYSIFLSLIFLIHKLHITNPGWTDHGFILGTSMQAITMVSCALYFKNLFRVSLTLNIYFMLLSRYISMCCIYIMNIKYTGFLPLENT